MVEPFRNNKKKKKETVAPENKKTFSYSLLDSFASESWDVMNPADDISIQTYEKEKEKKVVMIIIEPPHVDRLG